MRRHIVRQGRFTTAPSYDCLSCPLPRDRIPLLWVCAIACGVCFGSFLLFTVLVAVALLSAITTIRLTIHGRQENMPKLVGISLESAQRITSGLGLELKVEDKIYSTQYAGQ